ncbi:MAG: inositol monophosphatase family protein [bacterium]|nr:inositol monophosphatase family protein [bacterium]
MEKYLQVALKAVREAGNFLRDHFGKVLDIHAEEKKANDLVSFVDRETEEIIKDIIWKEFPDHQFIGEEPGSSKKVAQLAWVIDPLDGTKNFLSGIDIFAISCALLEEGEPIVGVVFNPVKSELFYALRGRGAFKNGKKIGINNNLPIERTLFATAFPFREKSKFDFLNEVFKRLYKKFSDVRRLGSASLDLCYVAEGIFSAFYEYGLSIWDIAAGALIVREAGGVVKDFSGGNDYLRSGNIVAGREDAVTLVLDALREARWSLP